MLVRTDRGQQVSLSHSCKLLIVSNLHQYNGVKSQHEYRDNRFAYTARPHRMSPRTSTSRPSTAAATAMIGLTRCVRPPLPCRPSKLRLDVDAQRSPGLRMSSFMPRHIEHPGFRHSNPASVKMRSKPSCSAMRFTRCE